MVREDPHVAAVIKAADEVEARLVGVTKERFLRSVGAITLTARPADEPTGHPALQPWGILDALKSVGEAAARVPSTVRAAHPEVDWRRVMDLGHLVTVACIERDWGAVWAAATVDVPYLRAVLAGAGPMVPAGWLAGPGDN